MRRPVRPFRVATAVATLCMLVLTGCAVEGTATRGPVVHDTGDYPTVPNADGLRPAAERAAARLGEHMPFRGDLDERMLRGSMTFGAGTPRYLAAVVEGAEELPENRAVDFGYTVFGRENEGERRGPVSATLAVSILRYRDAGAAAAAVGPTAEAIAGYRRAARAGTPPRPLYREVRVERPAPLPAGTRMVLSRLSDADESIALLAHGADVVVSRVLVPPAGGAVAAHRKALDALVASSTASRDVRADDREPDRGLFELTVPDRLPDTEPPDHYRGVVVGPRATAHRAYDSAYLYGKLQQAGVDAVAQRGTTVYRAGSGAQASEFADFLLGYLMAGGRPVPSPPDLPQIRCRAAPNEIGEPGYRCMLAHDRHVADAYGTDERDVRRRIAAQFVLLSEHG